MAEVKRCDVCGYVSKHEDFKIIGLDLAKAGRFHAVEDTKDLCGCCYESLLDNFDRGDYKCSITLNRGNIKNKP